MRDDDGQPSKDTQWKKKEIKRGKDPTCVELTQKRVVVVERNLWRARNIVKDENTYKDEEKRWSIIQEKQSDQRARLLRRVCHRTTITRRLNVLNGLLSKAITIQDIPSETDRKIDESLETD